MERDLPGALEELVERAAEDVRDDQIVDAYLAGGSAIYMHLQRAGRALAGMARYSDDADIHFSRPLQFADEIDVRYTEQDGGERFLLLDRTYSIDIGLCHPDYFQSATPLYVSHNGKIRLHLLSPLDLAVTKAGRYEDHDRQDIQLLARAGLLDAESFRQRAMEALDYLATNPGMVRIQIDEAADLIRQNSP